MPFDVQPLTDRYVSAFQALNPDPASLPVIQQQAEAFAQAVVLWANDDVNLDAGGGGAGGAPTDAQYILFEADNELVNAFVLADSDRIQRVEDGSTVSFDLVEGSVTNAYLASRTALSVIGRAFGSGGPPADIVASGDGLVLQTVSGQIVWATVPGGTPPDNSVTDAVLRDSAARSVIGRAGATSGDPADIVAGADGNYLSRHSGSLAFGPIQAADVPTLTAYVARDGSLALTGNWAVGGFDITGVDDLSLGSAASSLTVGSGSGSPTLVLSKSDAGTAEVQFFSNSFHRLTLRLTAAEDYNIVARDGSGVAAFTTVFVNSTGEWQLPAAFNQNTPSPAHNIGDGTGSPTSTIRKSDAGTATLSFQNTGSFVDRQSLRLDASENLLVRTHDAAGAVVATSTFSTSGQLTVPSNIILSSASPALVGGDGTGSPSFRLDKSDAGDSQLAFRSAGTNRSKIHLNSAENTIFQNRDSGGVLIAVTTYANTGAWTYPAGATYSSGSPLVVAGDTTGSPEIRTNKDDAGTGTVSFYNENVARFDLQLDASENALLRRFDSGGVLTATTTYQGTGTWQFPGNASFGATTFASFSGMAFAASSAVQAQLGSSTGLDAVAYKLSVADGSRNSRAQFFLQDAVGSAGAWGHALTWGSGGAQPYVILIASTEMLRIDQPTDLTTLTTDLTLSESNVLVVHGDSTSSPISRWLKSDAGTINLQFHSNAVNRVTFNIDASENLNAVLLDSGGVTQFTTSYFNATGLWQMPADLTLAAASPTVLVGDATGSPLVNIRKVAGGVAELRMQTGGSLASGAKRATQDASQDLVFQRYNGSSWVDMLRFAEAAAGEAEFASQFYTQFEPHTPAGTTQTIDWSLGNLHRVDLSSASGDVTLSFSNPRNGAVYHIVIRQFTVQREIIWPANVVWGPRGAPSLQGFGDDPAYDIVKLVYSSADNMYFSTSHFTWENYVAPDTIQDYSVLDGSLNGNDLRQSAPRSVFANPASAFGYLTDLSASNSSNHVLKELAGVLTFGLVQAANIDFDQVDFTRIQNINTNRLLGRGSPGSGDVQELTMAGPLSLSGTVLTNTALNHARVMQRIFLQVA